MQHKEFIMLISLIFTEERGDRTLRETFLITVSLSTNSINM